MLKNVILVGGAFVLGFAVGALSGFNAAVHDYIKNDAEMIQEQAVNLYGEEELVTLTMEELMEAFENEFDDDEHHQGSRGFQ